MPSADSSFAWVFKHQSLGSSLVPEPSILFFFLIVRITLQGINSFNPYVTIIVAWYVMVKSPEPACLGSSPRFASFQL